MPLGIAFWVIFLIWVIFSFAWHGGVFPGAYGPWGSSILLILLVGILGWHAFGAMIHG